MCEKEVAVSDAMPLSVDQYEVLIRVSQLTCTAGESETQLSHLENSLMEYKYGPALFTDESDRA
jgi:hypothetical protein